MSNTWNTPEQIGSQSLHGPKDLKDATHVGTLPGELPYVGMHMLPCTRGAWTIRQYAGFRRYQIQCLCNLAAGQGIVCRLDLATHRGYDSTTARDGRCRKAGSY